MIEVTVLPNQPEPRVTTAKRRTLSLKEHRDGFACANNKKGFVPEAAPVAIEAPDFDKIEGGTRGVSVSEDKSFGELLLCVAQCESVSIADFKKYAAYVKRSSRNQGNILSHVRIIEIMARLFGWYTWKSALTAAQEQNTDMIRNLCFGDNNTHKLFIQGDFVRPSDWVPKVRDKKPVVTIKRKPK